MFTYSGGDTVKGGFYWNRATWRLENVEGRSGMLPGDSTAKYARVPTLLMLVLAPMMGGLFVVFLPFIGFALLLGMMVNTVRTNVRKARHATTHAAEGHARKAA